MVKGGILGRGRGNFSTGPPLLGRVWGDTDLNFSMDLPLWGGGGGGLSGTHHIHPPCTLDTDQGSYYV